MAGRDRTEIDPDRCEVLDNAVDEGDKPIGPTDALARAQRVAVQDEILKREKLKESNHA